LHAKNLQFAVAHYAPEHRVAAVIADAVKCVTCHVSRVTCHALPVVPNVELRQTPAIVDTLVDVAATGARDAVPADFNLMVCVV
jgi:hypothetical protein